MENHVYNLLFPPKAVRPEVEERGRKAGIGSIDIKLLVYIIILRHTHTKIWTWEKFSSDFLANFVDFFRIHMRIWTWKKFSSDFLANFGDFFRTYTYEDLDLGKILQIFWLILYIFSHIHIRGFGPGKNSSDFLANFGYFFAHTHTRIWTWEKFSSYFLANFRYFFAHTHTRFLTWKKFSSDFLANFGDFFRIYTYEDLDLGKIHFRVFV